MLVCTGAGGVAGRDGGGGVGDWELFPNFGKRFAAALSWAFFSRMSVRSPCCFLARSRMLSTSASASACNTARCASTGTPNGRPDGDADRERGDRGGGDEGRLPRRPRLRSGEGSRPWEESRGRSPVLARGGRAHCVTVGERRRRWAGDAVVGMAWGFSPHGAPEGAGRGTSGTPRGEMRRNAENVRRKSFRRNSLKYIALRILHPPFSPHFGTPGEKGMGQGGQKPEHTHLRRMRRRRGGCSVEYPDKMGVFAQNFFSASSPHCHPFSPQSRPFSPALLCPGGVLASRPVHRDGRACRGHRHFDELLVGLQVQAHRRDLRGRRRGA